MVNSVIEKDVTVEGNITSSKGSVEVRGRVVGDLSAQAVTVHQGGTVDGALSAQSVTVEGTYSGRIQCEDLRLASSSQVKADVSAQSMATESGAQVEGNIKITGKGSSKG
ncbi:polymer-forming cytoskeletal protein [Leisingera sp. MMG026]|uniref:bactofilin family protein n=2 Tax=Leisingera TaxID=191028 RepID=UPI0031CC8273|nr:polymer-forming cytoskeletal protein [Leisingera sp. MMG026]